MHPDTRWAHAVSKMLGRTLTPYQRDMVEALSAPTLAGDGYAHPVAVVLMPRQTGKSTTLLALMLGRMMHQQEYAAAYTAQTGSAVTQRMTDPGGWLEQVERSPLSDRHRTIRSNARERIANERSGSFVKAFPPQPGKLRGNALDLVVLDECQEHDYVVGRMLEADIGPVFATRPRRQLILCGTASGPGWWREKVRAARDGRMLMHEVGTWPADADPEDPATWWEHHPGLQAGLTDEAFLASQLEMLGVHAFAREYGNRFDDDQTVDAPIPVAAWDACPPGGGGTPVAVAVDVAPDRRWCSVVGVTDSDTVRLLHQGPVGTLLDALPEVAGQMPIHLLPSQGGTGSWLRDNGYQCELATGGEYKQACQLFHDAVVAGEVRHDRQKDLREAWQYAGRAWHGDSWVLSARRSGGDITAGAAAVLAWSASRTRAPVLV